MPAWRLARSTYRDVKDSQYEVAVLPLGATEPHNLHLPYSMDTVEGDRIGAAICEEAAKRGAKVVLLPTLPYGTETNLSRFPLAMNLNPSTMGLVIRDLVQSVVLSGIRKIVLLNMHGGNEPKSVLRELHGEVDASLFACNWWEVIRDRHAEIFDAPEDHAGEMETSLALVWFPELVGRSEDGSLAADAGAMRRCRFEAVREGWVRITRPWHLLTTNAGAGNPHAATAAKGEQVIALLIERLAPFLVELSEASRDEWFPFEAGVDSVGHT